MIAARMRIKIVRISVAKFELMFSTPSLAKIAVSAAKTAERAAHVCQENAGCIIRPRALICQPPRFRGGRCVGSIPSRCLTVLGIGRPNVRRDAAPWPPGFPPASSSPWFPADGKPSSKLAPPPARRGRPPAMHLDDRGKTANRHPPSKARFRRNAVNLARDFGVLVSERIEIET